MKPACSFRTRLFAGFLLASLLPLLLCSALLLQVFRVQLERQVESECQEYLDHVSQSLTALYDGFSQTARALQASPYISPILAERQYENAMVYTELYSATEGKRSHARFDLYDSSGSCLYSTGSALRQQPLPTRWGILYAAQQTDGLAVAPAEGGDGDAAPLLQAAACLTDADGKAAGYLVATITRAQFHQQLDGTYGSRNDLLLLDRYWRPIYTSQTSLADSLAPLLRERLLAGQPLEQTGSEFFYRTAFLQEPGLYLVLQCPQTFNQASRRLLATVAAGSALICVILSVLMSLRLSRQMFRPIQSLHRAISQVVQNNLDVCIAPERNDELGQLAQRFNGMVAALKQNQKQLVENQRELNEAQIRMLQAQLNPHFLCNTLDTMKWISKINQMPQVALMSTDLADILRFCISPDEFVPLRREVEILHRYMEIQSIRLSGRCRFEVDLPPELEDCMVPKMILQPIVENAVLHGLDGVENGVVQVRARQRAAPEHLHIEVADNGHGIPPELAGPYVRPAASGAHSHLGLYNVDTILKKHYGPACGLWLARRAEQPGTVVTAVLPLRKEEPSC